MGFINRLLGKEKRYLHLNKIAEFKFLSKPHFSKFGAPFLVIAFDEPGPITVMSDTSIFIDKISDDPDLLFKPAPECIVCSVTFPVQEGIDTETMNYTMNSLLEHYGGIENYVLSEIYLYNSCYAVAGSREGSECNERNS